MTSSRRTVAALLWLLLGSLLLLLPNGSHAFSTVPRSSLVNTRQLRSIRASRDVLSGQDQRRIVLFSTSDTNNTAHRPKEGRGGRVGVIMGRIRQFFTILSIRSTKIKRIVAMLVLAAALTFGTADPALAGRSGGRAGGSFGRSCSPPISRMGPRPGSMGRSMGGRGHCSPSMRSSPMLHPGLYRRHPAIYPMPRPSRGLDSTAVADAPTETREGTTSACAGGDATPNPEEETIQMNDLVATNGMASPNAVSNNRGTRVIDPITYYAALTGVYGLVMYKANKGRGDRSSDGSADKVSSALGPGVSVGSVTVSLDVSDRDDPNCILARIGDIVKKAKTNTRKGVQSLIADVALEVLRQEASVSSACSTYSHLSGESAAERTYYQMSTVERSKFERESIHKFGGKKASLEIVESDEDNSNGMKEQHESKATSAVLTILLQIEGDQTKIPSISSRTDLKNALLRIAADAQIDDCLLSAEVLWTPERRGDIMSREDVASLYPELVIL